MMSPFELSTDAVLLVSTGGNTVMVADFFPGRTYGLIENGGYLSTVAVYQRTQNGWGSGAIVHLELLIALALSGDGHNVATASYRNQVVHVFRR